MGWASGGCGWAVYLLVLCVLPLSASNAPPRRIICWFRDDLRVHDNPMLAEASSYPGAKEVIPVYIFDPRLIEATTRFGAPKVGLHRLRFLIESVVALRSRLQDIGSDLMVGIGPPEELLALLVLREWVPEATSGFPSTKKKREALREKASSSSSSL